MRRVQFVAYAGRASVFAQQPELRTGVHYARMVLIGDAEDHKGLIKTGRGKSMPAALAGFKRVGRAIICWGNQDEIIESSTKSGGSCIVAFVSGDTDRLRKHAKSMSKSGIYYLVVPVNPDMLCRVIIPDDAKCKVQVATKDGWVLLQSKPSKPRKAATAPAQAKSKSTKVSKGTSSEPAPQEAQGADSGASS